MAVAAILDIDGTLVDSNYQHAIAWHRAFREHGLTLPLWRLHRHIGIGGDQFIAAVAGDEIERRCGDAVREVEAIGFAALIDEVQPLERAHELIIELKRRGHQVVLASSAKAEDAEHFVDLLEAREVVDAWTTAADVDRSKPAPDLVATAIERAGGPPAVMVGDTTWDVEAAARAGVETICVLTGGFGEAELEAAGAVEVHESPAALLESLDSTPLR
jgi:HAD superfamily hydrolase (TIGR01509 family)